MCLAIDITPLGKAHESSRGLGAMPEGAIPIEECGNQLTVSEEGGCACSLLSEMADWNAPTWELRPEVLEPLAQTVLALAERFPAGFTITPVWVSDSVRSEIAVTSLALANTIRQNRLANWTRYVVHPAAAV